MKPRITKPEMLRIGDTIRIDWPKAGNGIQKSETAKLGKRETIGKQTYYQTEQNGLLFATGTGIRQQYTLWLLDRLPELDQIALYNDKDIKSWQPKQPTKSPHSTPTKTTDYTD